MTKQLSSLFKATLKDEIDKVTYLSLGALAARYQSIVFNIAEQMMLQAISKAYKQPLDQVKVSYKDKGDMGEVAYSFAATHKSSLNVEMGNVTDIFEKLLKIAEDEGEGSQERKIEKTAKLLWEIDPVSAKFIARIMVGKLRLGFSDKTILDALSWMEKGDKSLSKELDRAYSVLPDVGLLAQKVKEGSIKDAVKKISPVIGVPVLSELAQRLKSPKEMIEKMGEVAIEPKFDGLRIQIHYKRSGFSHGKAKVHTDSVRAFTRNLNETSWMFPELQKIGEQILADEAIFDTEAMGVDEDRMKLANFQQTMTRRRKHNIEKISGKVGIKFFVFDILYKDGRSLINTPYIQRKEELKKTIRKGKVLDAVEHQLTKDPAVIEKQMRDKLSEGLEGIIVKKADSKYISGRTGFRWVKMKEEESAKAKLSDTVDCVVMGYITGRGKRTQFGIGGFLAGITDGETIKTLTKVGTGLSDDQFRELKSRLRKSEVKTKPKEYGKVSKTLIPDVWVAPTIVVELAADEITVSPIHSSGYALRFPRLVRFRDDKGVDQATSAKEIKKLYKL
jgi:DNA ligase-1